MKITIITILISQLFVGCNNYKNDLDLQLLNSSFTAYCPKLSCIDPEVNDILYYNEPHFNKVEFSITNNTDFTYVINPICLGDFTPTGCGFPINGERLSYRNLIVKNSYGDTIDFEISYPNSNGKISIEDSLKIEFQKKLGYNLPKEGLMMMTYIDNRIIVIPNGETLFFETLISIPINRPKNILGGVESFDLNINDDYNVSLVIHSDTTDLKSLLKTDRIKTFNINDYKFFNGNLISNKIPIVKLEKK